VVTGNVSPVPKNCGFTVLNAPPRVDSVSPGSGRNTDTVSVGIKGEFFRVGASVKLCGAGLPDINATSVTVTPTTQMTCNFDLTGQPAGVYDVMVTNDDAQSGTLAGAFTVNALTTPTWYLAEGTTAWGFTTYITIENPNDTTCTAQITYNTDTGAKAAPEVSLPPMSQTTVNPEQVVPSQDFSTVVNCKEGKTIAVDRTMTWTGKGAPSPEGHTSVGVTSPANTWYLAEGSSSWGFECWLLIQNPNPVDATCHVTYMIEGEGAKTVDHVVPANTRKTFDMSKDIGAKDASIRVESDQPVIPERSMYRNNRREGHDSIGTTSPSTDYYLAEGAVGYGSGFITYVLVQNPQNNPTDVSLTYMTQSGAVAGPSFQMPANSRKTIRVNDQLPNNTDVSTRVHGTQPIIAERAMYWGGGTALGEACHDSIGLDVPHLVFYLPDGQTSDNHETWTLVQNPNPGAVTVQVSYLTPSGADDVVFTDEIPAGSRKTYNMADKIRSGRAAIMVRSLDGGSPVMVERAMYWNSRGAGTDTIGGFSDH
jgi:hypothetical protein